MRLPSRARCQRGASLFDALLAYLVLSLGVLGVARLSGELRLNADLARQRAEALRLAQSDLDGLRGFTTLDADPDGHGYADITARVTELGPDEGLPLNTQFELVRDVIAGDGYRTAALAVHWRDRRGLPQRLELQSVIAGTPPALSGALALPRAAAPDLPVRGRSPFVPADALDLGDGRSRWRPAADSSVVWVFDNGSGDIVAQCPATVSPALPSGPADCTAVAAWSLSGSVRRSDSGAADAAHAQDLPLPLTVALSLSGATAPAPPVCVSEARKLVAVAAGSGVKHVAVPLDATPADQGLPGWTELGDRFVAYHCSVSSLQGAWSGRTSVVPKGWRIGTAAGEFRVCRYAADRDGSGAVDLNAEHPNEYHHVDHALMQQNFLVIPGPLPCPAAPADASPSQSALSTVQHQP